VNKQKRVAAVFSRREFIFVMSRRGGEAYYVQSFYELSDLSKDEGEINTSRDVALANNSVRN